MKMRYMVWVVGLLVLFLSARALAEAKFVQTPYEEQKVVFDFYFDDPQKTGPALFWVRALLNPLMDDPYSYAPEFMEIKVILHGTELVTVARHNYEKYRDIVERMRYYSELGVEFRVCAMAATDYGYRLQDFQNFIRVIPSAITELAHWQLQGYAVITPQVMDKKYSIEEIR